MTQHQPWENQHSGVQPSGVKPWGSQPSGNQPSGHHARGHQVVSLGLSARRRSSVQSSSSVQGRSSTQRRRGHGGLAVAAGLVPLLATALVMTACGQAEPGQGASVQGVADQTSQTAGQEASQGASDSSTGQVDVTSGQETSGEAGTYGDASAPGVDVDTDTLLGADQGWVVQWMDNNPVTAPTYGQWPQDVVEPAIFSGLDTGIDDRLVVTDVRAGVQEGFDRVVLEFEGHGLPNIWVGYTQHSAGLGSGHLISMDSPYSLHVLFDGLAFPPDAIVSPFAGGVTLPSALRETGDGGIVQTYGLPFAGQVVGDVVFDGHWFEGQSQAFISVLSPVGGADAGDGGATGDGSAVDPGNARPFRVMVLDQPLRLVIDIQH